MGYIIFVIIGLITIIFALLRSASKTSRIEERLYAEERFKKIGGKI